MGASMRMRNRCVGVICPAMTACFTPPALNASSIAPSWPRYSHSTWSTYLFEHRIRFLAERDGEKPLHALLAGGVGEQARVHALAGNDAERFWNRLIHVQTV